MLAILSKSLYNIFCNKLVCNNIVVVFHPSTRHGPQMGLFFKSSFIRKTITKIYYILVIIGYCLTMLRKKCKISKIKNWQLMG